ncbi:DNRLRE domain-containing protein [Nonomuraea sp. NPDC050328]|uniref:DNRLRE domain-containing protein n=1 Tax=Nonomuraea sp. NPDC050328 TaxID=3364361 RepID=UPI003788AA41
MGRFQPATRRIAAALSVFMILAIVEAQPAQARVTLTPPPAPDPALVDPSTAPSGPTAPDEASALLSARLTGKRVEIEAARSETSSTYANPDGTLTVETFSGPIRQREGEAWVTLDPTLVKQDDQSVAVRSHQRDLRIGGKPDRTATDLVTLGPVTLQWPGPLPAPQVSGDTVTYPAALGTADVVITATRTGAEQFVVVKERPATPLTYRLRLKAPGMKLRQAADGGVELLDRRNKVTVTVPAPVMWDAQVDPGSGDHLRRGAVDMRVRGNDLVITPDPAFLSDPATVYPVTVDPTLNLGQVFDTFVQQGYGTDMSGSTELKLGNNGSGQIARSFITWKTPGISGKRILSATLNLWNFHSWSCEARSWEVWSANQATTASRYPGPTMAAKYATSSQTKGHSSGCADGWVGANVTSLVQHWADQGWSESGMGLRASNESDPYSWKRFNSGNATSHVPYISVTYNSYPTKPQSVWVSPHTVAGTTMWTTTTTPQLRAHVGDQDGGNVRGRFEIREGGNLVIKDIYGAYVGSGGFSSSAAIPAGKLVNGHTYTVRGWTNDGSLNSKEYVDKVIRVDTAKPPAPAVTSSTHPDTGWHGDPGKAATFTATPGNTDTAWLAYRLDEGPTTRVATTGAAKTFSVTPATPGEHTVSVQTIDPAGNASAPAVYTFNVGAGNVAAPADGERTARRTELSASARSQYDRVTFEWRRAETDPWAAIPPAQVLGADGRPLTAWPVAATVSGATATVSGLTWNLVDQLGGDGAVQVRAVFGNASGATSPTVATDVVADRQASGAATEELGSGTVNLLTGDFRLEESEAELFGLALSRTASSRDPKLGKTTSPFGPEWSAGGVSEVAESEYTSLTETSASSVELTLADGSPIQFTRTGSGWKPEEGAEELTLTGAYTLKDADGVVTTFTKPAGSTLFRPATTTPPGANNVTRYVYEADRLKAIIAPTGAVADLAVDCALPSPKPGCRVLELVYEGDRVGKVLFHDSGTPVAVAQYAYDASRRLIEAWDPRVTPALKTTYAYDAAGRIVRLTPPGELPWTYAYDAEGRLQHVSRPGLRAGTADQVEGEARTSIVYDVPLDKASGGPADLKPQHTAVWGQRNNPTDATAILPPDQRPGSGWARATVHYLDASGREVNTLTPGGHLSVTEHDKFGNTVRELGAANLELALGSAPRLDDLGISALGTAERAELLSTRSIYDEEGQRELEEYGPLHLIGAEPARLHTVKVYDEGRPADAATKNLVTRESVGARAPGAASDTDVRVTVTEYDWKLGQPTKVVKDPGGLNLTTTTSYDAEGRAVRTTLPRGNAGATLLTTYYTATGAAPCGGKPAWAGLVCRTAPESGTQTPVKTTTYTRFGSPLTVAESAGGVTRTTHTGYDAADRPLTSWITGGVGQQVPVSGVVYSPTTGKVLERRRLDAQGNVTERVVTGYDLLGQTISYTDADGAVTTTEYDLLGRTTKVSDSLPSTVVYAYDHAAEPRGLATSVTDSVAGAFTARYDADGGFAGGDLPGGLHLAVEDDERGTDLSRVYTRDGHEEPLLAEQVEVSAHGQRLRDGRRSYGYDKAGRLTSVTEGCEKRTYTYDANTNRTKLAAEDCEGKVTETGYAYDAADRLTGEGIAYDQLGRTTALPGSTFEYHVNDFVHRQTVGERTMTWTLDAADRIRSFTGPAGTTVNHYDGEGDTPSWAAEADGGVTRNVNGMDGNLAALTGRDGQVRLQLTSLHGDVATELDLATLTATVVDADEFGVSRSEPRRYGWLGGKQRSAETLDGVVLMGVRLYSPALGRFLQIDPVTGGSANAYEYCAGDPVNCTDLDGKAFWIPAIAACLRWCSRAGSWGRKAWGWGKSGWRWGKKQWGKRGQAGRTLKRWASSGRRWFSRGGFVGAVAYGSYGCYRKRTWSGCGNAWLNGAKWGAGIGGGWGIVRGGWRLRRWWRRG